MANGNRWTVARTGIALVVGIILVAALVWGGLWFLQQRGETARRDETMRLAEQQLAEQSRQAVESDDAANEGDAATPAAEPAATPAPTTPNSTSTSGVNKPAGSNTTSSASQPLPQTGPNETAAIIGVFAMTFAIGSYVTSRRALLNH